MTLISFGIPSALSVNGAVTTQGEPMLALTTSGERIQVGINPGNLTLMISDSGNLIANVDLNGLSGVYNASFGVFPKYLNNFTVASGPFRYLWSGAAGTTGIASLPGAGTVSGQEFLLKNISTGAFLIISGSVDYRTNYTLYPTSAITLLSDNLSFIVV